MNVSPGNWWQTINQVLKLNPTEKEYMYLILYVGLMVGVWAIVQYDLLYGNCFNFLLWLIFEISSE